MRKRKYGYLLLTLLVVSGLAGTPFDETLSGKERKIATEHMKESRVEVVKSVKGLSENQLNFRPAPGEWSIKEYVYHAAVAEKYIWGLLETALKAPANPEKRNEIKMTDEQVVKMMETEDHNLITPELFKTKKAPYKSLEEAITDFKTTRTEHIKYIKNTTEALRNHITQTPFGWVDCYQISLFLSAHSHRLTMQIDEIKADPAFPKH